MLEKQKTLKNARVGLYIHIPFCIQKCPYCDFYSISNLSLIPDYINALIKEIQCKASFNQAIDTVYLGGGTPSVLNAYQIDHLCQTIFSHFDISQHAEITIEINPGTISNEKLLSWKSCGINRVNLGIQSFHDVHLKQLGRIYTSTQAHHAIDVLYQNNFSNIGIDLMYGIPGQSIDEFETDVHMAINYDLKHLSCYTLSYEPNTPLFQKIIEKKLIPSTEKTVVQMMASLMNISTDYGFDHYETSNYASSPSFRSKHNQKYWNLSPYIGLGASAHSYKPDQRSWNVKDIGQYIKMISSNIDPVSETEQLTQKQKMIEFIFLGLRTSQGIKLDRFEKMFSVCFNDIFSCRLEQLIADNYVERTKEACRLTYSGWFYLDSIIEQMVNCLE
jgi:oxygen-independent coproporphyrinogen-3 oxidase